MVSLTHQNLLRGQCLKQGDVLPCMYLSGPVQGCQGDDHPWSCHVHSANSAQAECRYQGSMPQTVCVTAVTACVYALARTGVDAIVSSIYMTCGAAPRHTMTSRSVPLCNTLCLRNRMSDRRQTQPYPMAHVQLCSGMADQFIRLQAAVSNRCDLKPYFTICAHRMEYTYIDSLR